MTPVYVAAAWAADGMASLDSWSMPRERLQAPSISKNDEFFTKQNIEFVWGTQGLDVAELNNIFTLVIPSSCSFYATVI